MSPADYARRWAARCEADQCTRAAWIVEQDQPIDDKAWEVIVTAGCRAYPATWDFDCRGDHAATALCLLAAILEDGK